MEDPKKDPQSETKRKQYQKPAIVFEQELEIKAGSPIDGMFDPLDLNSED
jgi:hypothetical protein